MDAAEFYSQSPKEFSKLLEIKAEEREGLYRQDMERMRLQTSILVNSQRTKKEQIKTENLIQFTWDEEKPRQDEEQRELTEDEWSKYDNDFPVGTVKKKEDG